MRGPAEHLCPTCVRLLRTAAADPSRIALHCGGRQVSYQWLAENAASSCRFLRQQGAAGKNVALVFQDSPECVAVLLGAAVSRCNVQVLPPKWPPALVTQTLDFLKPATILQFGDIPQIPSAFSYGDIRQRSYSTEELTALADETLANRDGDAPFYTGFTSGSAGSPKGFVRSESSWLASFAAEEREIACTSKDIITCPGSLSHSLFLYAVLRTIHLGATALLFRHFRPRTILENMEATQSTILYGVPTQLQSLAEAARQGNRRLPHLKRILSCGAKLSPRVRSVVATAFPAAEVIEFYGSSELSFITVAHAGEHPPPDSVGRALAGVGILIMDAAGRALPPGEIGLILVRSPFQFLGYAEEGGNVCLPQAVVSRGYLSCGDTGFLDRQGFLHLTGRADRMINVAGRNVFPETIETVLAQVDGVRRAAVLPLADPLRGHSLAAIIQREGEDRPLTTALLRRHCTGTLPESMTPRQFFSCPNWPKTVSHKTDLRELAARLAAGNLENLP